MAQALNALIPMGVQAPELGNALAKGVQTGNALANAPLERQLLEAKAKEAEAIAANGGISPYQMMALDLQRAGLGLRAQEMAYSHQPVYQQNSVTGEYYNPRNPTDTVGAPPANPYFSGKMTGEQGKVATFTDRMAEAHKTITDAEKVNSEHPYQAGAKAAFGDYATPFLGADMQQMDQAQRNFVNAVLRRESGAAIAPSEFESAAKQYFPQIGDSPDVIAQKRQNRITALQGQAREAGPSYSPPEFYNPQSTTAEKAGGNVAPVTVSPPQAPMPQEAVDINNLRSDPRIQRAQRILQNVQGTPNEKAAEEEVLHALEAEGVPGQVIQMLRASM